MAILIALAISLVAGIIVAEMYHAMPTVTDWLLRIATRRLSGTVQERCYEEWQAQLADIASPLLRLLHAFSLIAQGRAVMQEDLGSYFRELDADLDAALKDYEKRAENIGRTLAKTRAACTKMRAKYKLIRVAILLAMALANAKTSAKLRAIPLIWNRISPLRLRVLKFEKAIMEAHKLLELYNAKIMTAVCDVRAERYKAIAVLARGSDYETKSPIVASDLRRKLAAILAEVHTPDDNALKVMKKFEAAFEEFKNSKPDFENVRKLPF